MRARKNFSYLALLSLQSAPIPRKGKRPSLNLGDDTNFFAQFECAPLSSIIRRGVLHAPHVSIHMTYSDGRFVRKVQLPLDRLLAFSDWEKAKAYLTTLEGDVDIQQVA